MAGTMQTRFECDAFASQEVNQWLRGQGLFIDEKPGSTEQSPFLEIKREIKAKRGLWFEIIPDQSLVPKNRVFIDLHWLYRASDMDPDWMRNLAERIEDYLVTKKAVCVFGSLKCKA
jgi:hypothetical protein